MPDNHRPIQRTKQGQVDLNIPTSGEKSPVNYLTRGNSYANLSHNYHTNLSLILD